MTNEKIKQKQDEVIRKVSEFSDEYLDEEYKSLNIKLINKLIENDVSFSRGRAETWACGIIFAIGQLNFLFERSFPPYLSHDMVCSYFKIQKQTAWIKSRDIRRLLNLRLGDSELSTKFILSLNIPKSDDDLKRIRTFQEVRLQISNKRPENANDIRNTELLDSIHEKSLDPLKLRPAYFIRIMSNNKIVYMSDGDDKFYIPLFTDTDKCKEILEQFDNPKLLIWPFCNTIDFLDNDNFSGVIINPEIDNYSISKEIIEEIYPNYNEYYYHNIFLH